MRRIVAMLLGLAVLTVFTTPTYADTGPPVEEVALVQTLGNLTQIQIDYTEYVTGAKSVDLYAFDLEFAEDEFVTHQTPYSGDRSEGIPRLDLHPPNPVAVPSLNELKSQHSRWQPDTHFRPAGLTDYLWTIGRWV